jgi:hypothetical protein
VELMSNDEPRPKVVAFPIFPEDAARRGPEDLDPDFYWQPPRNPEQKAQREMQEARYQQLQLEHRRQSFVDEVAARLWVKNNPVEDRIDRGSSIEEHLENVARYCKQEAERLWRVLHP